MNDTSQYDTKIAVKAKVIFQRWEGDIPRFNGEGEFDASDALDHLNHDALQAIIYGDDDVLYDVYRLAVHMGQIHDYDGPLEVLLDEDDLSEYIEAREIMEGTTY